MAIELTAPVAQDDLTHADIANIHVQGTPDGVGRGQATYRFGVMVGLDFDTTRDPVTLQLTPQQIIDISAIVLEAGKPPAAAIAVVS
jgi:hypothetical protein